MDVADSPLEEVTDNSSDSGRFVSAQCGGDICRRLANLLGC